MLLAASPLAAQASHDVDAGLAVVRFPQDDRWITGPWIRASAQRDVLALHARGEGSLIASPGGTSGSAMGAASWRRTLPGALLLDAESEATALVGSASGPSASLLGGLRVAYPLGSTGGAWVRGAAHAARRESSLHGGGVDAAIWRRLPWTTLALAAAREWAQGQLLVDAPPATGRPATVVGIVPVRYTEGTLSATSDAAWGRLELVAGARRDPDAEQRVEAIGRLSAVAWWSPSRAFTVSVVRQPADYVRGADAMVSVSVGVRFGERGARAPRARIVEPLVEIVRGGEDAAAGLRVRAPWARTVEVMADFTGWEPLLLTPASGSFSCGAALTPGTHHLLVRVDGGAWVVPGNTPAVDDDLGGRVGLLVVP